MWEGPELGFLAPKKGQGEHRKQEHFPLQAIFGPPPPSRGVAASSLSSVFSVDSGTLDPIVDNTQPFLSR